VAIKFLSDELADTAARRRFQREAQMASSLNHPHILTVYHVGEIDGRQYLVTEFVDGGTLRNWARQPPHTWQDVVELLIGVADALATAHWAGILHRDIKPDNILITTSGYAKLADFGMAKLEDRSAPATRTITEAQTQKGMVVGTIAYMSPEQASGQALDARSDLFSFGTVLYEILAGRRPFHGPTNLALLQQVIHGKPAPLDARIPAPLRAVVMKALEKDPADRHASMCELVTAFRSARHTSGDNVASPVKRPRKWLAGAAAAALVGVVTLGAVLFRSRAVRLGSSLSISR
jgi:serine/threonine protein kinase